MGAVEDRGSAGGGGERRGGGGRAPSGWKEGGRREGRKRLNHLVQGWGERWAGIRGGRGSVGGTSRDWSGGGICLTVDPRGS